MRRFAAIASVAFCATAAVASLVYPLWIIQPFKYQNPVDLQRALWLLRQAPNLSLVATIAATVLGVWSLRYLGRAGRFFVVFVIALACFAAVAVRINVFEKMFHPIGEPKFLQATQAGIENGDMVLSVVLNDQAKGYPIREIGYHHVVNDWAGSVPVVVTY